MMCRQALLRVQEFPAKTTKISILKVFTTYVIISSSYQSEISIFFALVGIYEIVEKIA